MIRKSSKCKETGKTVVIEMPEYIREVTSEKFHIINTTTKNDWEQSGVNCKDVLAADSLTVNELEEALKNFDAVTFKGGFEKTKENATRLMLDLFLVFYEECRRREAATA